MNRRRFLTAFGVSGAISLAGCTESLPVSGSDEPGSTSETASEPGSPGSPWQGVRISVRGASASELVDLHSASVPAILTGENRQTAFVETTDPDGVVQATRDAGYQVTSVMSVEWTGEPICEIQSNIQLPATPSESAVRDTFSDAVSISKIARAGGDQYWSVDSRLQSQETITIRLDNLDVDTATVSIAIVTVRTFYP